jgi:hypothetical protein
LKTAAILRLNIFPFTYLMHRIKDVDTIIVLTDSKLDAENHVNRCTIRTATHAFRSLSIPVMNPGHPTDEVLVEQQQLWLPQFMRDLRRSYRGLKLADDVENFVGTTMSSVQTRWMTDYLLETFLALLKKMGWQDKEVIRGSSALRRRYGNETEYLLDLCIDSACDRVIVGNNQQQAMNQRMFRRNEMALVPHKWEGTPAISARDCILDVLARFPVQEVKTQFDASGRV